MKKRITFVGLDTHKNSIEVALADDGRNTEVRVAHPVPRTQGCCSRGLL